MTALARAGNCCTNFPTHHCQWSSLLTATHLLAESSASLCQGCPLHRLPVTVLRHAPKQYMRQRVIEQPRSLHFYVQRAKFRPIALSPGVVTQPSCPYCIYTCYTPKQEVTLSYL